MSFNDLAPELLSIIVHHLRPTWGDRHRLWKYATVSAAFRGAVESMLFSSLLILSSELEDFERIVWSSSANRRDLVGRLCLRIVLPTYTDLECALFENAHDRRRNNKAFTSAITRLFSVLSSSQSNASARPLRLTLTGPFSPMDGRHRATYWEDKQNERMSKRKDLFELRYDHSYLHLIPEESSDLRYLPRVTELAVFASEARTARYVAPSTVIELASRLPNLERLDWELSDNERRYPSLRYSLREEFSRGLATLRTPRLQHFELRYTHETPNNQSFRNLDLMGESAFDPFSTQLRQYLQTCNLLKVDLIGPICLGPDFFIPEGEECPVQWPQLRKLTVHLSHVRPDGGWYLERKPYVEVDPDEEVTHRYYDDSSGSSGSPRSSIESDVVFGGSQSSFYGENERQPAEYDSDREGRRSGAEPERLFRSFPTPELEELFEVAARAARRMPHLQMFYIGFHKGYFHSQYPDLYFKFASGGIASGTDLDLNDLHRNRLIWQIPRGWRVGPSLEAYWNEVIGDDGIVKYEKW